MIPVFCNIQYASPITSVWQGVAFHTGFVSPDRVLVGKDIARDQCGWEELAVVQVVVDSERVFRVYPTMWVPIRNLPCAV